MRFVSGYYLAQVALQDRRAPRKSTLSRVSGGFRLLGAKLQDAPRAEVATGRIGQRAQTAQVSRSAS